MPKISNPILDPGAPVSFAGLDSASSFAELAGLEFELEPPKVQRSHGFGPDGASGGDTIAVWNCRVEDIHGEVALFQFDIIHGDAPVLLGLDYDKNADTSSLDQSPTWCVSLDGKRFTFGVYVARDCTGNYRRFVEFRMAPRSLLAMMSRSQRNQGAVRIARLHPNRFALRLHGWSHLPLAQMRRLAKQASVLTPQVERELVKVAERCDVCPLTGSNVGSAGLRRVSLTKFVHPEGNRLLEVDHVSHVVSVNPVVRERLCLSMACKSTGYGESPPVANKGLPVAVASIELTWILRHGAPEAISADPGLGGKVMKAFCDEHQIRWEPRPPRRHNTIGVVERRNGVMRMVLERLVTGNDSLPASKQVSDALLLERSNFLVNLILGDATLSSFQLLKGYQPSLVGLPASELSSENIQSHIQISTSRALSRLMRSKSFDPYRKPPLTEGQIVSVHTQRHVGSARGAVGWAKHRVYRVDADMVATRPLGRTSGKMNLTSFADVRVPPSDPLAQEAFNFALHQPIPQVGRWEGEDDDPEEGADAEEEHEQDGEQSNRQDVAKAPDPAPGSVPTVSPDAAVLEKDQTQPGLGERGPDLPEVAAFYSRIDASALTRDSDEVGDVEKDVGTLSLEQPDPNQPLLQPPNVQAVCEEILASVGRENVTRQKLTFVPPWLLDEALEGELKGWDEHIQVESLTKGQSRHAVIGSHVLYCVKSRESGEHYIKARLVIHGNEERNKEDYRSDASSLHFTLIRVILSMAVCLGFKIGGVDVTKAYHQSGQPPRDIRVRPPAECMLYRTLWLLMSLPYGLVDASRQWQLAMDVWLLDYMKFVTFGGLPQVFAKLDSQGAIVLLIGKVTDDILCAGKEEDIEAFFEALHARWDIGKAIVSDNLLFNGARILRDHATGEITLSMEEYLQERVSLMPLTRERRKQQSSRATDEEAAAYRSLAGTLNFLGTGALPEASFISSVFLQRQSRLLVHDIMMGNRLVSELKKMEAVVKYAVPGDDVRKITVLGFSDASFNVISGSSYGQSGYVAGLLFESGSISIFHVYDWYSAKQKRVVYSSFGAEILACADADNRLFALKMGLQTLLEEDFESELLVDSKGLFTCITTLSDQREYRLRRTVSRIRESFDSEELNRMRWISGVLNLADAPTKWNPASWTLLQQVLNSGTLPAEIIRGEVRGDKPAWRRNLPAALSHV